MAANYNWKVNPADAGNLVGNDTVVAYYPDDTWVGDITIKVQAVNACGGGLWSDELDIIQNASPATYTVEGGGAFCLGDEGCDPGFTKRVFSVLVEEAHVHGPAIAAGRRNLHSQAPARCPNP